MKLSERMRELKDKDSAWTLTIGLVLIWADEVAQLENNYAEAVTDYHDIRRKLQAENGVLRERSPKVQISDGDVWLHFPYASLSIEGICKFGVPGPIVRRNLRKWRDALLTGEDTTPSETPVSDVPASP